MRYKASLIDAVIAAHFIKVDDQVAVWYNSNTGRDYFSVLGREHIYFDADQLIEVNGADSTFADVLGFSHPVSFYLSSPLTVETILTVNGHSTVLRLED